jgi:2-oxoisovalerate dehydrogenase E1 component
VNIRGIKVVYPSNGADLKGLLKAAYYDPNPVVILEHKGLYWSKIPGTEDAMSVEPDENYRVPLGLARSVLQADVKSIEQGTSLGVVTYGRGVYWALEAAKSFDQRIEILDLRSLNPLDENSMVELAKRHGKILVVTEESKECAFGLSLLGRIQQHAFEFLDAPVALVGSVDTPAIPLNSSLEEAILPNAEKVRAAMENLISY